MIVCCLCETLISGRRINSESLGQLDLRHINGWTSWALYFHNECIDKAHIFRREEGNYGGNLRCQVCKKPITEFYFSVGSYHAHLHVDCFRRFVVDSKLNAILNLLTIKGMK